MTLLRSMSIRQNHAINASVLRWRKHANDPELYAKYSTRATAFPGAYHLGKEYQQQIRWL